MFAWLWSIFQRHPVEPFIHDWLGPLVFLDGMWRGQVPNDSEPMGIIVAGDSRGPDQTQLRALERWLKQLPRLRHLITVFVSNELSSEEAPAPAFKITSLAFLWPQESDYFIAFLEVGGDEYGVWKVEFISGRPEYLSRDD